MMQIFLILLAALADQAVSFSLYAYGRTIPGLNVFYDNDLAYVGYNDGFLGDGSATNISCTLSSGTLSATPNTTTNSNITWSSQKMLYVVPGNSISQAGFIDSNTTVSNAVTDGWLFYGRQLINNEVSSDGSIQSSFWAIETNTTGLWTLNWNSGGKNFGNGMPVALKTAPPPPPPVDSSPPSRR